MEDKFGEFCKIYKKTYPGGGPSMSSSHSTKDWEYMDGCGCWECLYERIKQRTATPIMEV